MGCDYYESTSLEFTIKVNGKYKLLTIHISTDKRWIYTDTEEEYNEILKKILEENINTELSPGEKEFMFNKYKYVILNSLSGLDIKLENVDYNEIIYSSLEIDNFIIMSRILFDTVHDKNRIIDKINHINNGKRKIINYDLMVKLVDIKKKVSRWERI